MTDLLRRFRHLIRRAIESSRRRPIDDADVVWVRDHLHENEFALWSTMQLMDRGHSIGVARRLVESLPSVDRTEVAAALLHDVGKISSNLGLISRIAATLSGPRTVRWKSYRDHERVGAELCRSSGVDPRVCDLVGGRGSADALQRLRNADNI